LDGNGSRVGGGGRKKGSTVQTTGDICLDRGSKAAAVAGVHRGAWGGRPGERGAGRMGGAGAAGRGGGAHWEERGQNQAAEVLRRLGAGAVGTAGPAGRLHAACLVSVGASRSRNRCSRSTSGGASPAGASRTVCARSAPRLKRGTSPPQSSHWAAFGSPGCWWHSPHGSGWPASARRGDLGRCQGGVHRWAKGAGSPAIGARRRVLPGLLVSVVRGQWD